MPPGSPDRLRSGGPVERARQVEAELARERAADRGADQGVGHDLVGAIELECGDASKVDRPDLMAEDDGIERLACVTGWDRDLGRIPGSPRR